MEFVIIIGSFILILFILFCIWYKITKKTLDQKTNEIKNNEDELINLLKQLYENLNKLYQKNIFENKELFQDLSNTLIKINTEVDLFSHQLENLNKNMLLELEQKPQITSNQEYINYVKNIIQIDIKIQVQMQLYNELILQYNELISYKLNKLLSCCRKSTPKSLFKYQKFELPINKQYL